MLAICPMRSLRLPDEYPDRALKSSGFLLRTVVSEELVLEVSKEKGLVFLTVLTDAACTTDLVSG